MVVGGEDEDMIGSALRFSVLTDPMHDFARNSIVRVEERCRDIRCSDTMITANSSLSTALYQAALVVLTPCSKNCRQCP